MSKSELWKAVAPNYHHLPFLKKLFLRLRIAIIPIDAINDALPKNFHDVLDLGCGLGLLSFMLRSQHPNAAITGLDYDSDRIAALNNLKTPVTFTAADAFNWKPEKHYDTVLAIDLIHHIPKDHQLPLLKRIYDEFLTPGGVFIFKDINTQPIYKYWFNYLHDSIVAGQPLFFRPKHEYRVFFESLGYIVTEIPVVSSFPYPHYLFKCIKPNQD